MSDRSDGVEQQTDAVRFPAGKIMILPALGWLAFGVAFASFTLRATFGEDPTIHPISNFPGETVEFLWGMMLAGVCCYLAIRSPFAGVFLESEELVVRGIFRTRRIDQLQVVGARPEVRMFSRVTVVLADGLEVRLDLNGRNKRAVVFRDLADAISSWAGREAIDAAVERP